MGAPRLRVLVAALCLVFGLGLILLAMTNHQSSLAALLGSQPSASHPHAATVAGGQALEKGHAAPDLEALLPNRIDGTTLRKGSTVGSVVFGSDAFSQSMTAFLTSIGKTPANLRFANARDPAGTLDLETGVFQVRGVDASALQLAIVNSSRPDAPGLTTAAVTLSGKQVTMLLYPGGSNLYLYAHGDRVFYVGTQSQDLAARVLALYP